MPLDPSSCRAQMQPVQGQVIHQSTPIVMGTPVLMSGATQQEVDHGFELIQQDPTQIPVDTPSVDLCIFQVYDALLVDGYTPQEAIARMVSHCQNQTEMNLVLQLATELNSSGSTTA